jgi:hypothetical protein
MEGILTSRPLASVQGRRKGEPDAIGIGIMATRVVVSLEGKIVTEVALTKPVTVVGRHPDCDIFLDHPAVSLRHALFRTVGHTVYLEDLASTNGTRANGIAVTNRVLHHLDLVQIGMHKLHFFDESLLAGAVGDLEHTVFNEYEMTMLAPRAAREAIPEAPRRAPAAGDDGLSATLAIRGRADGFAATPAPQEAPAPDAGALALQEIGREEPGRIVALDRANTMIGEYGAETALIVKRGHALFLSRFAGLRPPRLNGVEVGPGAHVIGEHDRVEIGAEVFEVIRLRDDPGGNKGT